MAVIFVTLYSSFCHVCLLWIHALAELLFEADLTNLDRAMVHVTCKRLGLKSKSRGYVLGHLYLSVV
jgi:hypothetical protein